MNSPTCCSMIFFVISTASLFVLNRKAKTGYFMSTALCKLPFFLYYVYNEWVTSTNDFSVKEATFNLKLAECMQKTSSNLNPALTKNPGSAKSTNTGKMARATSSGRGSLGLKTCSLPSAAQEEAGGSLFLHRTERCFDCDLPGMVALRYWILGEKTTWLQK